DKDLPWRNSYTFFPEALSVSYLEVKPIKSSSLKRYALYKELAGLCKIIYAVKAKGSPPLFYSLRKFLLQKLNSLFTLNNTLAFSLSQQLLPAMLFGEKNSLTSKVRKVFQQTGISHLLVISGYHLTVVFIAVRLLLMAVLVNFSYFRLKINVKKTSTLFACLCSIFYALLTGFHSSAQRAAIGLSLYCLSTLLSRYVSLLNTLLFSALLMLIINPAVIFSVSFQFTFLALTGIVIGVLADSRRRAPKYAPVFFASCLTSILTLYYFNYFSLIGFFTNIVVAPLLVVLVCNIGLLFFVLYLATGITAPLLLLEYPLRLIFAVLKTTAYLPYAAVYPQSTLEKLCWILLLSLSVFWIICKRIRLFISQYA
ncbi:MAG: ComEC/Rec2 family competence protein, partial [Candidatus Dadabacteria bacterium]